jgi:hypothetical protein
VYDDALFPDTAVVALDMVCQDEWKKSTAQVGQNIDSFGW